MAHLIENTLAILRDVMNAHRSALSGTEPPPPTAAAAAVPVPGDPRAELIMRLLAAVEERCGLDINPLRADKLLRVLAPIATADLSRYADRLARLPADDPEWQTLIENLTVHETYVMRDPEQLLFFCQLLPGLIAQAQAARTCRLRFWSIGCSTGEETYTIAALAFKAMMAAGHAVEADDRIGLRSPWQIEVLGSDISRRAVERARTGRYETGPLSSFRGELADMLRFFPLARGDGKAPDAALRSVHECLRAAVRFEPFNLVADPAPLQPFDAVFCRNVLVHFSARARGLAHERMAGAVRPGGYLLLGPTDSLGRSGEFEAMWAPGAVIQRRRTADG
jgi:chemotaxis protein methyltransferase CheR